MAAYEHLPIFKKMMDLSVFMEQTVSHFSRYHRYTLGSELRSMCHEALGLVVDANNAPRAASRSDAAGKPEAGGGNPSHGANPGRRAVLLKLRNLLERIKIHLMLAREVQAFNSKNSFVQAAQMVVELSRQNEGWLKTTV